MKTTSTHYLLPVVLSGGSGTRLWPLSRDDRPKQFLPLASSLTLFQETLSRSVQLGESTHQPLIVCSDKHGDLVMAQARAVGSEPSAILLEPEGRNTAPAITVAALVGSSRAGTLAGDDPLLLVLPADHVFLDPLALVGSIRVAIEVASRGYLVAFGIVPDRPETGYGYIERGPDQGGWSTLRTFVEKPDAVTAKGYVDSGRYLWNSGMFLFSASAILQEMAEHEPAILDACRAAVRTAKVDGAFTRLGDDFLSCVSKSIDYAVMERTKRAAVVPLAAGWSDVGSWSALHDVLEKDAAGNVLIGDVLAESCTNCYVRSTGRVVAAVGVDGIVVVETDDAVLVMSRDHAQRVKQVVEALKARQRS